MLFAVQMDVQIPANLDPQERAEIVARERRYAQQLQQSGEWPHLWRIVGRYANLSIFDVADNDRLHEVLAGLPLFPYLRIEVTPLARHPSAI
jgi:muconolactone D-isomerase